MGYAMEAEIEATRLEEQVHQSNYSVREELDPFLFRKDEFILDAGCGTGVLARHLVKDRGVTRVDGMDFSALRVRQAEGLLKDIKKTSIRYFQQDLTAIDTRFHGLYDTVICRYVIEHVERPDLVLQQLCKTLRPNGRLIVIEVDGIFYNLSSENAEFNTFMNEFRQKVRFDLNIGRRVPNLMHSAGFEKIEWDAKLVLCKDKRLEEEKENTIKRFAALGPFLISLFGSSERAQRFQELYLREMTSAENTLVFTKYTCAGKRG